jgi:hypothetical protein
MYFQVRLLLSFVACLGKTCYHIHDLCGMYLFHTLEEAAPPQDATSVAPTFNLKPVAFAGVDEPAQHEAAAETSRPEELQACTSPTYSVDEVLARLPPDEY